jgi:hypothetical protein
MNPTDRSGVIRLGRRETDSDAAGRASRSRAERGTLDVKLSIPVPPNEQSPHAQDEVYA